MPDSDFNAEEFLSSAVGGAMSTETIQCPEGVYKAQLQPIGKDNFRRFTSGDATYTTFEPSWEILDDDVRAQLDRDRVFVRQSIFLDFDENGALDTSKGKNVDLGRLRAAVGQNEDAEWSFSMLNDVLAQVRVKHQKDKNSDTMRARVTQVTALA